MPEVSINYAAVLVSALAVMAVGFVYYAPNVMGNKWMKLAGIDKNDLEKGKKTMGQTIVLAFASALVLSYVLAHIVDFAGAKNISGGMQAGFWVWLGFVATSSADRFLWEKKRPWGMWVVNNVSYLITYLVVGSILAVWQ
jgi:hypothetical protein